MPKPALYMLQMSPFTASSRARATFLSEPPYGVVSKRQINRIFTSHLCSWFFEFLHAITIRRDTRRSFSSRLRFLELVN
ncbi:hypothetical protein LENED_006107 [Lentinula edodes]|uniref:Uncharacterized protein n=1 Tax=Lentinula edodes TaxID=5353 RepID=A0A1Q3EAS6_LENED|nr:hypothetical protein LENED_006107 [Lentinula edodes]